MSEFKLAVSGLEPVTEPVLKLIESVSKGLGKVYEPLHIRRIARAEVDGAIIRADGETELARRALERVLFVESARQRNIEAIIEEAKSHLPTAVSSDPVSDDWIARFFGDCQDVSEPELRTIWARILAGEIAKPGRCSRRTLSVLRDLGREDAVIFGRAASLAWSFDTTAFIPRPVTPKVQLSEFGLHYGDELHLESLGLVHAQDGLGVKIQDGQQVEYGGLVFSLHHRWKPIETHIVASLPLSTVGMEMLEFCIRRPHEKFIEECERRFASDGLALASPIPRMCANSQRD